MSEYNVVVKGKNTASYEYVLSANWNDLPPPNRRCYMAKRFTTTTPHIEMENLLTGYKSCEVKVDTNVSSRLYGGFSGSGEKTKIRVNTSYFYFTYFQTETDVKKVIPTIGIATGDLSQAYGEITDLNPSQGEILEVKNFTVNAQYTYTFEHIDPTLTNLSYIGNYYEAPITVNWRSESQERYEYELYYNNVKIATGNGTTEKEFVIPKDTFPGTLPASVRVRVSNTRGDGVVLWSDWSEINLSLKEAQPELENLSLSGSNIDYDLTFSWDSIFQDLYELEVTLSDNTTITRNGTTAQQELFSIGTLKEGSTKFKMRVGYTPTTGATRWSSYKTLAVDLIESKPYIGVLQPDGQLLKKEDTIQVYWTSSNQTNWSLKIGAEFTANGTIEKEVDVPPNTLSVGTKTMELTVNYVTQAGVTKTTTKTTQFLIAGKPPTPTFTSLTSFSTARPLITWDAQDQEGYNLTITDATGNIMYATGWKSGLVLRQKVFNYLANGAYKASLQVINTFGEESDTAVYSFNVNATPQQSIALTVNNAGYGNELSWNNDLGFYTAFYIIRNDVVIAKIVGMNYNDYTCKNGNNVYTVRGVTSNDLFTDSNSVTIDNVLERNTIALVDNAENYIFCDKMREGNGITTDQQVNTQLVHLTGRKYPVPIYSEFTDATVSFTFVSTELEKMYQALETRGVFVYRDGFGNVVYCCVSSLNSNRTLIDNQMSIDLNLIDYTQEVEYD